MAEPTAQVPVSLIKTVRAAMDTPHLSWSTRQDIYRRLDALIAQPTPSAESDIEQWHREQDARLARMRALDRDPSTIRDVTPPAEVPDGR